MMLRRMLLAPLVTFTGSFGAAVVVAPHVQALSCAVHPDGSPEAILAGTEQLSTGESFFNSYDLAVSGTVTAIETDEAPGSPTYGDTLVSVDVINAFGVEEVAQSIVVFEDDPGWMSGYAFELGKVYFIPLQTSGPDGQTNYSFSCDPIALLDQSASAKLPAHATSAIRVAYPAVAAAPNTTTTTSPPATSTDAVAIDAAAAIAPSPDANMPAAASTGSGNADWAATIVVVLLGAGVVSGLFVVRQRRITAAKSPA